VTDERTTAAPANNFGMIAVVAAAATIVGWVALWFWFFASINAEVSSTTLLFGLWTWGFVSVVLSIGAVVLGVVALRRRNSTIDIVGVVLGALAFFATFGSLVFWAG